MEEELNTTNPEIVEDMPEFEENTAENPCESDESVCDCTDSAENENVSEENEGETEESAEDCGGSAEKSAEDAKPDTDKDKAKAKTEPKKPSFKSNLPTGFSFNPLVVAIKPFYDALIADDEIFANVVKERENRKEKPKSLSECAEYIMSEAYNYAKNHKQGNFGLAGFPDEEMPRLIRHYYDEEFLEVQKITGATASFSKSNTPAPVKFDKNNKPIHTTAKTEKKGKDKPKPVNNVLDITKAIVSSTATETGKKAKKKDSLSAGFVPMERPATLKDAKRGSRQQAKSVETIDMFADFFATEE